MELHVFSIEDILLNSSLPLLHYRNDLILSDDVGDLLLFREPFRVDALTVLVCAEGSVDGTINLAPFHAEACSLILSFPGDVLQITATHAISAYAIALSSTLQETFQIDFRTRTNLHSRLRTSPILLISPEEFKHLLPYYALMRHAILSERAEVIRCLSQAFTYNLYALLAAQAAQHDSFNTNSVSPATLNNNATPTTTPRAQVVFERFLTLLSEHHNVHRSVRFYASRLGLSPNYLSEMLREHSGKTAMTWIKEAVILEAKMLLRYSDMNVQQIAYYLHFSSQSSFGKYFRSITGVSPKDFRLRSLNG